MNLSQKSRHGLHQGVLDGQWTGQIIRTAPHLISKTQLLQNDRDWDSDTSQLTITSVLEAKGGTVSITQSGDILFTPDASFSGVMSFKYTVQDQTNQVTNVINSATNQTEQMKAAVYLQTGDLPSDPLAAEQWYLTDTNVMAAWGTQAEIANGQGYSGKGIKIGQFEPGGPFSTGPEVFDYRHPDLAPNADKAWLNEVAGDPSKAVTQTFSNHATMVAGVMVAARNGEGGVGVAYNSTLAGHYIQGEGLEINQLSLEITNALAKFKNYDVVNNSWGATNNFQINVIPTGTLEAGIKAAVEQKPANTKTITTKTIALFAHSMQGRGRFDLKKQRQWINRSCVANRSWRWSPQHPAVQSSELMMEGVAL